MERMCINWYPYQVPGTVCTVVPGIHTPLRFTTCTPSTVLVQGTVLLSRRTALLAVPLNSMYSALWVMVVGAE